MPRKRTRRLRSVLLAVVAGSVLAVSSCQEGGQGVTTKEACHNGALFDCANPLQFDA